MWYSKQSHVECLHGGAVNTESLTNNALKVRKYGVLSG